MKRTILRECIRRAREINEHRSLTFRHYSFVIQNNAIVEMGQNVSRASPLIQFGYPETSGIHAEANAYRKAKGLLDHNKPWEMVNIRLNRTGNLKLSKPCQCCYNFLQINGCRFVYFSTDAGFARIKIS